MKRVNGISLCMLALSAGALAQSSDEMIDRALAAAPRNLHDAATVIKWKADFTYDTIKKGTNRLVCYDRSGEPGRAAFAVQCTSLGNVERIAQNRKFEAIADKADRQKQLDAAEANGTRVKPEFGSVWLDMNGPTKSMPTFTARLRCPAPLPSHLVYLINRLQAALG